MWGADVSTLRAGGSCMWTVVPTFSITCKGPIRPTNGMVSLGKARPGQAKWLAAGAG